MMSKRYLDIKENSLEASVFEVLNNLQEKKVVETNKNDKSDDGEGLDAVQPKAVKKKFKDRKDKDVDNDGDVDSSDEYLHKRRKAVSKAMSKEEVELDEKAAKYLEIEFKDKTTAEKAYNHINNKIEPGGRQPWDDFNQEGSSIQFDNMRDADGLMKELKKKFKFKVYEREEVELDEGKMSQLHQMIKDKKTAAQIAKEMKLDVKTVKALMSSYEQMVPESLEIGTEKYLKHTVETTPGQKAWTEVVTKKATSMRETLAKIWKADEGKNVFAKEAKKDLTNDVKGGKTMTGKKISVVDTSPTIKEKKK